MGRYGHHNNVNYRNPNNSRDSAYIKSHKDEDDIEITTDFDVSTPRQAHRELDDDNEQPNIVSRIGSGIKKRYQTYNSEEAKEQRELRSKTKRMKKLGDLSYQAKKESLKANIRKSKQTAPMNYGFGVSSNVKKTGSNRSSSPEGRIHLPSTNYGSMDRMFGIGTPTKSKKIMQKGSTLTWGNMNRMFGVD